MSEMSKSALKALNRLKSLEGAVKDRFDPWQPSNLLRSSSPGVNSLFGHTWGFPRGYSMLLWGIAKSGKSLLSYDFAGNFHKTNPAGVVLKFDTEQRDTAQLDEAGAARFGIDLNRWIVFQGNRPENVWDRIRKEVPASIQEGLDVGLIIVDSISEIQGRREANNDSVNDMTIGDQALTNQIGLRSILDVQRAHRIGLILIGHAQAEMDPWKSRKNKTRPGVAGGVLHHTEFHINVERNETKTGNQDELEQSFVDDSRKGFDDKGETTAHKVRVWMQSSTFGCANRVSEFTLDYQKGITNQFEEVFKLGVRWGVILRPNAMTYQIGENKFVGKPACLRALAESKELQQRVIDWLMKLEGTSSMPEPTTEEAVSEFEAPPLDV
jgi:recA bacterial DNA recombination protein